MTDFSAIDRYIAEHLDASIAELSRLCAQPSVSATGEGIEQCAALVADLLRGRGFRVEIERTGGNPIIFAEADGASDKTLLFYNHYDVQPPEPLELWTTPAFTPTLRDGKLFARGVSDDKGHIICRLAALDAIKAATGSYPCKIKWVIEGEEETSSGSLYNYVPQNVEKLRADGCIWEYGTVNYMGNPLQILGMRGICYVELHAKTADLDTHSGVGGSVFQNAAWRLVWALNSLKGEDEKILIPGFYDDVIAPTAYDMELLANIPDNTDDLKQRYGLKGFIKGLTNGAEFQREAVFTPTCTICGLNSGYQGPGSKTIIPAQASAKVDFRLVPNQRPEDILKKLRAHLDAKGFADIEIEYHGGGAPGRTDPADPLVKLAVETAREVYGRDVIIEPMTGGSGPNALFIDALHIPIIMVGVGNPGDRLHAPDENVNLEDFVKGTQHTARVVANFPTL